MVNRFKLKTLFPAERLTSLVQNYGLKRMDVAEINYSIQSAFSDYILSALSEIGDSSEDKTRIYLEATHHISQASKLLEGMPHPAGKMSYRLDRMTDTLTKMIEGSSSIAAERATRFMEKNLIRRLRDIWSANTSTPFHTGGDGSGRNPRDFILDCLQAAYAQYPEIEWFNEVDLIIADALIKSIKR